MTGSIQLACCSFYCCGVEHGPRVALTPFYHASDEGVAELGGHVHRRVVVHLTSAQVFPPFKSSDF